MAKLSVTLIITCLLIAVTNSAAQHVGVCYGLLGDNLPPATKVIEMYHQYNIWKMRLFDPNPPALEALRNSGIEVTVGIKNEDLPNLAVGGSSAKWFADNIEPYVKDVKFAHITVGNEVIPGPLGVHVLPVMKALQSVIDGKALSGIKLTTVVPMNALSTSYPPSSGTFSESSISDLSGVLGLLSAHGSPLMVNVYPYFPYASDPADIPLDYALFNGSTPVMDGPYSYYNLFDAMLDAFAAALEKVGAGNVSLAVSESGWPSAGNCNFTSVDLAGTYNNNLVKHLEAGMGTPRRLGAVIPGHVFAMFNEDLKTGADVERNFGLFYANMTPVYHVF